MTGNDILALRASIEERNQEMQAKRNPEIANLKRINREQAEKIELLLETLTALENERDALRNKVTRRGKGKKA